MKRVILHVDMNNFYASVECMLHPELQDFPLAVTGDQEKRHGIVLAKNQVAKRLGVKTGEVIWKAKLKCPGLLTIPAHHDAYLYYSQRALDIYREYTDWVESFGLDEAWLDVSKIAAGGRDGEKIADEIRERMKTELGLTVSVGVSFNKIFAKLGSDLKKPDATVVVGQENYRDVVWPLPVGDLLYVGKKTERKLRLRGISTIGDVARTDPALLRTYLGKWGEMLHLFANGRDETPVRHSRVEEEVKSIGNSTTTPRDLINLEEVKTVLYILSESVAERMRAKGMECRTVRIKVRDNQLVSYEKQVALKRPTHLASEIAASALALFQESYGWERPVRSLGVEGAQLIQQGFGQLVLFEDHRRRKQEALEGAVDDIRRRFGRQAVARALVLEDRELGALDPVRSGKIHPVSYF